MLTYSKSSLFCNFVQQQTTDYPFDAKIYGNFVPQESRSKLERRGIKTFLDSLCHSNVCVCGHSGSLVCLENHNISAAVKGDSGMCRTSWFMLDWFKNSLLLYYMDRKGDLWLHCTAEVTPAAATTAREHYSGKVLLRGLFENWKKNHCMYPYTPWCLLDYVVSFHIIRPTFYVEEKYIKHNYGCVAKTVCVCVRDREKRD